MLLRDNWALFKEHTWKNSYRYEFLVVHWFWLYSLVARQSCTSRRVPSTFPVPYLLAAFPVLYLLPHDSFVITSLCLLVLSPFSLSTPSPPPLWQPPVLSLLSLSFSILFVYLYCSLDSTYKWNHMVFVFLWLTYFHWASIHAVANGKISSFFVVTQYFTV